MKLVQDAIRAGLSNNRNKLRNKAVIYELVLPNVLPVVFFTSKFSRVKPKIPR